MTFETQFPSFEYIMHMEGLWGIKDIEEHCLDKQKVKELLDYLEKCCKSIVGEIPKRDCKFPMTLPVLQLAQMKQDLQYYRKELNLE